MIDLHSHILPGLDDGARNLDEAVEIARAAAADGTRAIAATPHVRSDYLTTPGAMERGVGELRAQLAREAVDVEILPGGEIALEQLDALSLDDLGRFGLGGNPGYLLLETPYAGWPLPFGDVVFRLVAHGITPVIGHPERNPTVQTSVDPVAALVRAGALVQITAAAVDGRLGTRIRSSARRLLDAELVHLIASDAHSPALREVGLSSAFRTVGDDRLARWLTEGVPGAIVRGEPLPRRPRRARRGFRARLRGR